MTGAQTDRIETPPYVTAANLLLNLAGLVFEKVKDAPNELNTSEPYFTAWNRLRRSADIVLNAQSPFLSDDEFARMSSAMVLAHKQAHGIPSSDESLRLVTCECKAARDIAFIALALKVDKERRGCR